MLDPLNIGFTTVASPQQRNNTVKVVLHGFAKVNCFIAPSTRYE